MNNFLITICVVNYNSSVFVEMLLYSLQKLTISKYKVIVRDNNSEGQDYDNLQKIVSQYENIELFRVETSLRGSLAHGEALNDLVAKINTPYGVIVDADVAFLVKGWDDILIKKLSDEVPIIGTQADMAGGKPKDFPLMFALLFKTKILQDLNIDFRPKDIKNFQDTGWELREKYLSAGYGGKLLYDFNTRIYKKGPFADIICSEYYMSEKGEGNIFACHFGRGSAPSAKNLLKIKGKTNIMHRIINKFLQYPNILIWRRNKKKWLSICQEIINKQIL